MYLTKYIIYTIAGVLFCTSTFAQKKQTESLIIAKGAKPVRLSDSYSFTEGPAVDKAGNVYFTDQPNNKIIKWSASDGKLSVYMDSSFRSNGLYFDKDDNLISCADLNNQLIEFDKDKNITVLVENYQGKLLNGPNDLWIDKKGGIYVTDPFYKRNWWKHNQMQQDAQCVYYLSPDKKQFSRIADGLLAPNGIIGTPDNKNLYVSDINAGKTYVYKIQPDGSLTDKQLFIEKGSDGMTIDNKGNVYITNAAGVTVFNMKGEQIEQIPLDEKWTANVCFGGKNRNILFITASKSVFTLDMKVKGAY